MLPVLKSTSKQVIVVSVRFLSHLLLTVVGQRALQGGRNGTSALWRGNVHLRTGRDQLGLIPASRARKRSLSIIGHGQWPITKSNLVAQSTKSVLVALGIFSTGAVLQN